MYTTSIRNYIYIYDVVHSIAINVIRVTYVRIAYVFHVLLLAQKVAIVETTTDAIVKVAVDIEASTSGSASTSVASSRTSSRVGSRRVSTNAPPTPPRKRAYARAKLFALDDRTAHIAVLDARGVLHIWGASLGTKTVEMAINIAAPPASPSTASVRRSVNIRSSQNVTDAVKGVWAHAPPSQLVWLGVSTGGGAVSCSVLLTEACTLSLFSFTILLTLSFAFSSLSLVALSLSLSLSLCIRLQPAVAVVWTAPHCIVLIVDILGNSQWVDCASARRQTTPSTARPAAPHGSPATRKLSVGSLLKAAKKPVGANAEDETPEWHSSVNTFVRSSRGVCWSLH